MAGLEGTLLLPLRRTDSPHARGRSRLCGARPPPRLGSRGAALPAVVVMGALAARRARSMGKDDGQQQQPRRSGALCWFFGKGKHPRLAARTNPRSWATL